MTILAIVVTHNSRSHVSECVSALLRAGAAVSVVDNASSDGTGSLVAERFPGVRLLQNDENVGFARAVNQVPALMSADVVLLVNPDCVVPPGTVRALVEHLATNPGAGVVAPRLLDARGRSAISAHPFESPATVFASRFGGSLLPVGVRSALSGRRRRASYDACTRGVEPLAVDWVSGACLAVRGSLLHRLGGLDTRYFLYYEDEELCLQVWRAGSSVVLLPAVTAVHLGGASSHDPVHVWPHLYRSLLRFQARHHPRTYALVRATILARAVLGVALGTVRDAAALAQGLPARRTRAWLRVARIAAFESGHARAEVAT